MPYTIGEVARMMNIAPSTLRYYEKEGLLSLGARASNGQRTYTDDDIATLSIIEYLKFCGLPLKEIRSFLPLIRPGGETLSARRDILAQRARQRPRADYGAANEARTSGIQLLVLRDRAAVRFGSAAV